MKTGHTLYSSVLFYEACLLMQRMATFAASTPPHTPPPPPPPPGPGGPGVTGKAWAAGCTGLQLRSMASRFARQAERTKQAINARFWDADAGGYRASTGPWKSRTTRSKINRGCRQCP